MDKEKIEAIEEILHKYYYAQGNHMKFVSNKYARQICSLFEQPETKTDGRFYTPEAEVAFARSVREATEIRMKAQEQARAERLFQVGDKFLEILDHADFSNGNVAQGVDEGEVLARRLLEEWTAKWQALKKEELPHD